MSDTTKIEWADATFNPWIGCTKVSPGCQNCYASTYGRRFGVEWGPGKQRKRTSEATWRQVERWNREGPVCVDCGTPGRPDCECGQIGAIGKTRRPRIFPSLCDPFDPEAPVEWFADFLDLIRRTPNIDWLLLTKRPEAWLERVTHAIGNDLRHEARGKEFNDWLTRWANGRAPANVWLGVSAEDQRRWDERVPVLLSIPARVRFVSVEPMLGAIDLKLPWAGLNRGLCAPSKEHCPHWVIFGGESGPKARPCNVEWIRDGVRQCREAVVKAFVKQDSGPKSGIQGRIDGETWKVKEFPNAL